MREIHIDEPFREQLGDLTRDVAIKDETGEVFAYFVSPVRYESIRRLVKQEDTEDEQTS